MNRVDPQTLETWLEWAAAKLIAMPAGKLKPQEPRACWPDFAFEPLAGLSSTQANKIRALAPSANEIPIVDLIILLPNVCEKREVRQILHWRAQVHPIRQTHLNKWDWIARKLQIKTYTAHNWHKKGLQEACVKADKPTVCLISAFMQDRL